MAFDKLIEKIIETQNPTVAGLDPKLDYVPASIKNACFEKYGKTLEGAAAALLDREYELYTALYPEHPEIAAENAARDFGLDQKEQSIIRTHMWPLTLFHVPASREAWIVTIADKLCGAGEI